MINWLRKRGGSDGLVALCPGTRGVAAAQVKRVAGNQPVLEWAEFMPSERRDDGRRAVIERLVKSRNLAGSRCTSLVQIGDYHLILVEAPDVPAAEIRAAMRWRVKDLIDFSVDDAVIDVFKVPTLKGGQDNMLYAVVARSPTVRALIDEIKAAGAALEYVDIPEFAIRNLTALMPEDVGGVAFIHLEEQIGLITITRQRTLYLSRRFDYGRARLLDSGARTVTPAIEGLLDAIVIEVQRSLDYYESRFAQPPVQGVVMAPLGAEFQGIAEYLGSQLGVPTRVLRMADVIEMQGELTPSQEAECVAAVGAALRLGEASL